MLLPLAFLGLGLWERQRGADELASAEAERARLAKTVSLLAARPAPANGGLDMGAQFRRDGRNYVGPMALSQAREALDDLDDAVAVARFRTHLPPVLILCAGLAAGLSLVALAGAALLGRAGRASRDALVRGFSVVRRVLPPVLGAQVLLAAAAFVAAVAFEALAILEAGDLSTGGAKLLGIAGIAVALSLWSAFRALMQLRGAVALFAPDPMVVHGRPVTPEAAPGLWRLLDGLAARLGALRPDNVVVGLMGGFFVSSGPKVLEPGGAPLAGRTLYLPLPYLPLLREEEAAAIIGHELAHFSGGDTEYSLRFVPIYAGVGRSLDAVAMAGMGGDGTVSPLMRPALMLGTFAMDRFHHAVRHWSRLREFAADAAGAGVTSADAAAGALLRVAAAHGRVEETLEAAFAAPATAPPDLVAATLRHAMERGLDDPAPHLEEAQPHPTDTHPPTRQRLAALGREPAPSRLAEAAAPPPPEAWGRLGVLFADPAALCADATADFLAAARDDRRAAREALEEAAAAVAPDELTLHENTRAGAIVLITIGAVLAVVGAVVAAVDIPGHGARERWIVAGTGLVLALGLILGGVAFLRRGDRPFAILGPEGLTIPGLSLPVAWGAIADLDMTLHNGTMVTRMLLAPGAPFPERVPGRRRASLDPKRRIVTLAAAPPRGMKPEAFAALIARYRRAEAARRLLAEEAAAGTAPPIPQT